MRSLEVTMEGSKEFKRWKLYRESVTFPYDNFLMITWRWAVLGFFFIRLAWQRRRRRCGRQIVSIVNGAAERSAIIGHVANEADSEWCWNLTLGVDLINSKAVIQQIPAAAFNSWGLCPRRLFLHILLNMQSPAARQMKGTKLKFFLFTFTTRSASLENQENQWQRSHYAAAVYSSALSLFFFQFSFLILC